MREVIACLKVLYYLPSYITQADNFCKILQQRIMNDLLKNYLVYFKLFKQVTDGKLASEGEL